MLDFRGRTVIVTGATGNLGAAVTQKFINQSANLVLTDRGEDRLGQRFPKFLGSNQHILADRVDVTNSDSVNGLIGKVLERFKHIDVLVNTVGGFSAGTILPETPLSTLDFMLSLNARSVFVTSQAVLPHMIKEKQGKIVNLAARAGLRGSAKMSAYSASKAAVIRLTESMAEEVKNLGINVNCILPGTIDTPQNREAMPGANYEKWVKTESVADVIVFLASDYARDIHGAAIPVYGNS
ncbi:MAG: SDR family oxidoreductase [Anaerolineales bacterium]|nr:SDR family oxidoreductase [Anaerolineales bacterium]